MLTRRLLQSLTLLSCLFVGLASATHHDSRTPNHDQIPTRTSGALEGLSKRLTNAERLSLNLPLNPPLRRTAAQKLAARLQASPVPNVSRSGRLQVFTPDDEPLGYVSDPGERSTCELIPGSESSVLAKFSYDPSVSGPQPVEISMEPTARVRPLLGLTHGFYGDDKPLAPGAENYLFIEGVGLPGSPLDSPPVSLGTNRKPTGDWPDNYLAASFVWRFDKDSGIISPRWVNPDGEDAGPLGIYLAPNRPEFYVARDFVALARQLGYRENPEQHIIGPLTFKVATVPS